MDERQPDTPESVQTMDLTTRCPSCGTTFAASLEQLQLRKGYIRCVQCAHIFDGYEAVVPGEPAPGEPAPGEPPAPSVVRGRREFTISDQYDTGVSDTEPFLIPPAVAPDDTHADFGLGPDPVSVGRETEPVFDDHVQIGSEERDTAAHYSQMWREQATDAPSRWWRSLATMVWLFVITAGVVIFAVQLAYVFRVQLAEKVPSLRPALERLCTSLDCTVAYARQPDMIVITQSSLQQESVDSDDGTGPALLQFTLRNVHDQPQEWPTVTLDLKDISGAMIARKNLPKDVYLPVDMVNTPFPANSEWLVVLPLTTQGLEVNGYQLTIFFP